MYICTLHISLGRTHVFLKISEVPRHITAATYEQIISVRYLAKDIIVTSPDSCSSPRISVKYLPKCFNLNGMIKTKYNIFSRSEKIHTTGITFYSVLFAYALNESTGLE